MKAILNILRSVLALILVIIFIFLLTLTPVFLSATSLVTQRQNILSWVSGSGAYDEISKITIENIQTKLKDEGVETKNIKGLDEKLAKVISPTFVKTTAENTIHGVYDWLEGKTEDITVETKGIDFQEIIKEFIPKEQLKDQQFMQLLSSLKPCTTEQAQKYEKLGGFSSIEDFCLPPSLNLIKIANESYDKGTMENIVSADNIFQIPEIPQENSQTIKFVFILLKSAPVILGVALLLLLISILFLSPTKYFKMYALSFVIILNAFFSIFTWKSTQILSRIPKLILDNINQGDLQIGKETIQKVISITLSAISTKAIEYSMYIAIAGGILLVLTISIHLISGRKELKIK